jgi:EAL domain-containing protein (putative c-di-GMP-specific phosphodiesterase class I)/ActR/RegA family two-component response regulator
VKRNRLLVVDDDDQICELIRDVAEPMDFDVRTANTVGDFFGQYDAFSPTAVFVDLNIGDSDGVQVLHHLAEKRSRARVVMISGVDGKLLDASRRIGEDQELSMVGTLSKPIMLPDMEATLFKCMLRLDERELVTEDLQRAIASGELTIHFQPILAIGRQAQGKLESAEALVRWQHPERGLLLPDSFIGLASDAKTMSALTDAVLLQTVEQIHVWQETGLDIRASVNLTCSVIDDPDFPERLSGLMRQFDVKPERLVLELSERGSLHDILKYLDILTRLRLKGFGLALDDFGTGESALVHLHKLPFSALKIDRCFIQDMAASQKASLLVKSIIDLAHNLDMEVCAEGVADRDSLRKLIEYDCDYAQGYLFSEAIPVSRFAKELGAWRKKAVPA